MDQIVDGEDPACNEPIEPCESNPNQALCKYQDRVDVYEMEAGLSVGPVFARHIGKYYSSTQLCLYFTTTQERTQHRPNPSFFRSSDVSRRILLYTSKLVGSLFPFYQTTLTSILYTVRCACFLHHQLGRRHYFSDYINEERNGSPDFLFNGCARID